MDQLPFNMLITLVGCNADDFIEDIRKLGYDFQADQLEKQFKELLEKGECCVHPMTEVTGDGDMSPMICNLCECELAP